MRLQTEPNSQCNEDFKVESPKSATKRVKMDLHYEDDPEL